MKRCLITSALPYINGTKHLGNLVGSLLPSDVYSRYLKQQGKEVLFICGTDEHGTPAEIAASESGENVDQYCNVMHQRQKEIYESFDIEFDYFGRSSSETNHELTKHIFNKLDENDLIYEKEIEQIYSIEDERYLPDRYVVGTCPKCSYDKARGDQCDGCGSLLEPTQLIEPRSSISGSVNIEVRRTSHLFLRLSVLEGEVRDWVAQHPNWSTLTMGIAKKWLSEGLKDRCITRDLKWGVSVPREGFEDKVFYVWFDAPIAYISSTMDWAKSINDEKQWEGWWKDVDNVEYFQFMAKDNVPFHTIYWPAMMIGTRENWKLVDYIKGFNWLTYDGGKFSTSLKRGVFTDQAIDLFPADYWRYSLLSIAPESSDSDFDFNKFAQIINKDLADVLGNYVNRVVALVHKYFDGEIPPQSIDARDVSSLESQCREVGKEIKENLDSLHFRQLTQTLRALWSIGNEFITAKEPWKLIKFDKEQAGGVLNVCLHLMRIFAIYSYCVIPNSSRKILVLIGQNIDPMSIAFKDAINFDALNVGRNINKTKPLFAKITEEQITDLTEKFQGKD